MSPVKPLIVAVSGPSSSGKTTVSRLLRDIFNGSHKADAVVLHQDDFYKPDFNIPVNGDGLQDWDCVESIDWSQFERVLSNFAKHGSLPADFQSKEDKNAVGDVAVKENVIRYCEAAAWSNLAQHTNLEEDEMLPVAIVDGFLLLAESVPATLRDMFNVKLFLQTDYKTTKSRREARKGYVTIEGFWEDPPGYVDKVVWPHYVEEHKHLFHNQDVDGELDEEVLSKLGIEGMPGKLKGDLTGVLQWALTHVCMDIRSLYHRT